MSAGRAAALLLAACLVGAAAPPLPLPLPLPVAGYGTLALPPSPGHRRDLTIVRLRDGASRTFAFDAAGRRDAAAIAGFLEGGPGRVERVFDRFADHALLPPPGARGPMVLAGADADTDGLPGLLFDNSGAFEGDVAAIGRPAYAVGLSAPDLTLDPASGFTIIARMRLGNVVSIASGQLFRLAAEAPDAVAVLAGWADPARPEARSEDLTALGPGQTDLGLPPPSTPSVVAIAADRAGTSVLLRDRLDSTASILGGLRSRCCLLLGTTQPGGGGGFALQGLLLFDHRLAEPDIRRWAALLRTGPTPGGAGTLVLDGSSVEAGVGSTGLRNQSRLYEPALPGFEIDNVAVGGARTVDRLRALPATLRLLRDRPGARVLLCAVGANSLATGTSATDAYAQISDYVRRARDGVPGLRVGLATLIPNGAAIDLGRAAAFDAYNALVRRNQAGADFIADRAADPVMGDARRFRPVDPLLSADGAHPTDFGHRRLAAIDVAAIRAALGRAAPGAQASAVAAKR